MVKAGAFRKKNRLARRNEIAQVRKKGQKKIIRPFVLYRLPNELGHPRLAMAITKKSGKSVTRNRARRLIREYFRTHKEQLGSFDYFFYTTYDLEKTTREDWKGFFGFLDKNFS